MELIGFWPNRLASFSKITQTSYHPKEFSNWNLILKRIVKFGSLKGALVPWEFKEVFVSKIFLASGTSFKSACLHKQQYEVIFRINGLV